MHNNGDGPVTPHGDIDLRYHWTGWRLVFWWPTVITWTSVASSSNILFDINLRAILYVLTNLICNLCPEIILWNNCHISQGQWQMCVVWVTVSVLSEYSRMLGQQSTSCSRHKTVKAGWRKIRQGALTHTNIQWHMNTTNVHLHLEQMVAVFRKGNSLLKSGSKKNAKYHKATYKD